MREKLVGNREKYPDGVLGDFPEIPTVFVPAGNVEMAKMFRGYGEKLLMQMSRKLGYNEIEAGAAAHERHEYEDGSIIEININHGLSTVMIYIPQPAAEGAEEEEVCPCCIGCLMVGIINSVVEKTTYSENKVDIILCSSSGLRAVTGVSIIDTNSFFALGDKVLVYATPALVSTGVVTPTTTHRRVTGGYRPSKKWQVFNCMSDSDVGKEGVDLTPVGLDTDAYVPGGDACGVASAPMGPPGDPPPPRINIKYYVTSIFAGNCLEIT